MKPSWDRKHRVTLTLSEAAHERLKHLAQLRGVKMRVVAEALVCSGDDEEVIHRLDEGLAIVALAQAAWERSEPPAR